MRLTSEWIRQQGDDAALLRTIDAIDLAREPEKIAVAVSGGGDSMALLHLFKKWSDETGVPVIAATVDHGLRAEAADEAAMVAGFCVKYGIFHEVLKWDGAKARGNVQAAARNARYALLAGWAVDNGTDEIVLGHTADDVAETFLMNLARKSGVDGLSAMTARFERDDACWNRPLWQRSRAELRAYLQRHNVSWIEDPSNDDLTQTRPKARKILKTLEPLGIDVNGLTATATALASSRSAVEYYTCIEAERVVTLDRGDIVINLRADPPVHPEIERRIKRAAIRFINREQYGPRESAMVNLDAALRMQKRHTVGGCLVSKTNDEVRFSREVNATEGPLAWGNRTMGKIWDARWRVYEDVEVDTVGSLSIRALGERIIDVPDWRETGLPRTSLLASPAVFDGETLISAPVAGLQNGFSARIVADFTSFLLSR